MTDLQTLRAEIDAIDAQILQLLAARFEKSAEVGAQKKLAKVDVFQPQREQEILQKLRGNSRDLNLPEKLIEKIFTEIFLWSRRTQTRD